MENSHRPDLTTSQQLANLRLHRFFSDHSERVLSDMRAAMANAANVGQPTATREWPVAALAWELAITAQSSAYLAESLQCMAERSATRQTVLPELTYRQLLGSIETFRDLLDTMRAMLDAALQREEEIELPVLSVPLAAEIRSQLVLGRAITMAAYMISIKSQETKDTQDAGDTR